MALVTGPSGNLCSWAGDSRCTGSWPTPSLRSWNSWVGSGLWQVSVTLAQGASGEPASAHRDGLGSKTAWGRQSELGAHLGAHPEAPPAPRQAHSHVACSVTGLRARPAETQLLGLTAVHPAPGHPGAQPHPRAAGGLPQQTWSTSCSLRAVCQVIRSSLGGGAHPRVLPGKLGSRGKGRTLTPGGSATATVNNRAEWVC